MENLVETLIAAQEQMKAADRIWMKKLQAANDTHSESAKISENEFLETCSKFYNILELDDKSFCQSQKEALKVCLQEQESQVKCASEMEKFLKCARRFQYKFYTVQFSRQNFRNRSRSPKIMSQIRDS